MTQPLNTPMLNLLDERGSKVFTSTLLTCLVAKILSHQLKGVLICSYLHYSRCGSYLIKDESNQPNMHLRSNLFMRDRSNY